MTIDRVALNADVTSLAMRTLCANVGDEAPLEFRAWATAMVAYLDKAAAVRARLDSLVAANKTDSEEFREAYSDLQAIRCEEPGAPPRPPR